MITFWKTIPSVGICPIFVFIKRYIQDHHSQCIQSTNHSLQTDIKESPLKGGGILMSFRHLEYQERKSVTLLMNHNSVWRAPPGAANH